MKKSNATFIEEFGRQQIYYTGVLNAVNAIRDHGLHLLLIPRGCGVAA